MCKLHCRCLSLTPVLAKKIVCTKKVYHIDHAAQFLLSSGLIKQASLHFRRKELQKQNIYKEY